MRFFPRAGLMAALALACSAAFGAGTVNVTFNAPESFTDFGFTKDQAKWNAQVLSQHIIKLATGRLVEGQTLDIEVLDVDLAGTIQPGSDGYRVVKGNDWTRIHLRYTLRGGTDAPRTADTWVNGVGQSFQPLTRVTGEEMSAERRMLDEWFRKNINTDTKAP